MPSPSIDSVLAASAPTQEPIRQQWTPRPNYRLIHQYPLPVQAQPLPPLFPHNPLSYIHVALAYVIQLLSPAQSHPKTLYRAYLSSVTQSVHVTDEATIRALWEMGFFGKGSLSRSEPEWLDQERKKRGISKKDTSTDVTRTRRDERKEFKLERARQEREAIKQKLKEEALSASKEENQRADGVLLEQNGHADGHLEQSEVQNSLSASDIKDSQESDSSSPLKILVNGNGHINHKISASTSSSENGHAVGTRDDVSTRSSSSSKTVRFSPTVERVEFETPTPIDVSNGSPKSPNSAMHPPILNQEHLQLTYEEAFFLSYGLGVLQIFNSDLISPIPSSTLLQRFLRAYPVSYLSPSVSQPQEPDDPFLLSYAAYHHFRSLGWVVRSGAKFSVDYLLYERGPVFSHAQFAVIVLPSYSHSYWATESGRQKSTKNETKSWSWLHCVNRVQTAVQKNLVLCYVEVPPPVTGEEAKGKIDEVGVGKELDIGEFFKRYKIREINIQRWSANRMK